MSTTINIRRLNVHVSVLGPITGEAPAQALSFVSGDVTPSGSPYVEVRDLGGGEKITQQQMLTELQALQATAPAGQAWRIETPHELFSLVDYSQKNQHGAYTRDPTLKDSYYWTSQGTPWFEGGRVVVGFGYGNVSNGHDGSRAFARAVLVSGQ